MKTQKLISLLLAVIMIFALAATVFATGENGYTITINPNPDDKATHTYEAYQLFKGTLFVNEEGKKILSNITWGNNIDQSKLEKLAEEINKIIDDSTLDGYPFYVDNLATDTVSLSDPHAAANFADAIGALQAKDDGVVAQRIADAFSTVLTGDPVNTCTVSTEKGSIIVQEAGYYLVKDKDNSLNADDNNREDSAYTRYILQVVSDVEVTAKSEVPTVDKKIEEGEKHVDANTASIGDEIPYVITSKVPDMTGYNKYYFILNDTMSKGLTFNEDVKITIGSGDTMKTLEPGKDFTVEANENYGDETTIKIVLNDFIQYMDRIGQDITITYTATLNENADLTEEGNVNTVKLTYSNNPNYDYKGENEPNEGEPTGETPEREVKTYTTGIALIKVDADTGEELTGAKFLIQGDKVNVTLINEVVFEPVEEGADGEYYMLKDGTYTKDDPDEYTEDNYDSLTQKYNRVERVTEDVTKEQVTAEGYVNEDGILTFEGLAAGEYIITELVAPNGYNLLSKPITVLIEATPDMDDANWEAFIVGENGEKTPLDQDDHEHHKYNEESEEFEHIGNNDLFQLQVENKKGTELPSTGGIGTTIFYVLGAVLALGAGVVLVSKKRTENA